MSLQGHKELRQHSALYINTSSKRELHIRGLQEFLLPPYDISSIEEQTEPVSGKVKTKAKTHSLLNRQLDQSESTNSAPGESRRLVSDQRKRNALDPGAHSFLCLFNTTRTFHLQKTLSFHNWLHSTEQQQFRCKLVDITLVSHIVPLKILHL